MHRLWLPDEDSPGLAMSRAFGDYCLKDFGLIATPEVSHAILSDKDEFLVLATDGVSHTENCYLSEVMVLCKARISPYYGFISMFSKFKQSI